MAISVSRAPSSDRWLMLALPMMMYCDRQPGGSRRHSSSTQRAAGDTRHLHCNCNPASLGLLAYNIRTVVFLLCGFCRRSKNAADPKPQHTQSSSTQKPED
jgi:hypothetical protein